MNGLLGNFLSNTTLKPAHQALEPFSILCST
jgi:hypothetical protein